MPTLTIRERGKTATGFEATLSIDHQAQYEITISDPFDAKQEQELEFYFEEWITFPFDQKVKAQRAAASIQTYGHDLFEQVFAERRAYSAYERACQQGLSNLQIEILGESPEFQALHWEALKDPDQPRAFAVDCVVTRKRLSEKDTANVLQPSATINLLVVTARPDEESDVGYRTISRPLIEAIQQAQLRVNVELLRPGTYQALSEHLEDKEGYYHIVHFDVHGGLMTHDQFQAGAKKDRYTYQARYGRSDMQPYDGVKAFLFLEGKTKGKADPVEAGELAELLINKGIPVCILNACQSGKQVRAGSSTASLEEEGESEETSAVETSLGSRLMAAGVQMVVAMGYSVTVSAAALMMEKLYGQLFAQKGIPEAIRLGRKELYNQKNRRVYFNQIVELEDWLLPVMYANREVDLKLRDMDFEEEEAYYEAITALEARYEFQEPTYGFVGRDLDILKIEKALFRHNILLLRGMGGTGKTTLLRYLWRWWLTTNFVEDAFYFGYDDKAYTVEQIVHEIGKQVYARREQALFQAMNPEVQAAKLAKKLCEEKYVLILDNLESVTGQELAIQNTLPQAEQQKLCRFLAKLINGKTRVLLGSRSGEDWLASVFTVEGKANVYQLAGLDPESRSVLAEKVLAAQVKDPKRIAALRVDAGFKRLMKMLAGYPLAMEVVLGNLVRQTPEECWRGCRRQMWI
ncbi:MAG: CHAT domain-containing protein [Cyanobacteria bacterium P01_A01_bin.137]